MENTFEIMDQENAQAFVLLKLDPPAPGNVAPEKTVAGMFYYDFGIDKEIVHHLVNSYVKRLKEVEVKA